MTRGFIDHFIEHGLIESENGIALRSLDARCGTFEVFENRRTNEGRKIPLNIAVVPALARRPKSDPLFLLAGGPGQAATELAPLINMAFKKVRTQRDIVLVDQRGTGQSNPLECDPRDEDDLTTFFELEPDQQEIERCVAGFDAELDLYTTDIAMDDLNDVRSALGYGQINLWGGSYGTRAALVYLRRHGDSVRTAVLDGVAPPAMRILVHAPEDAEQALNKLVGDCERAPSCVAQFPGLKTKLTGLLHRLESQPVEASLRHPRTGKPFTVRITREIISMILFAALYDTPSSALVPLAISKAHDDGDFAIFTALVESRSELGKTISQGMQAAVLCNEDLSAQGLAGITADFKGELFRSRPFIEPLQKYCHYFAGAQLPKDYFAAVRSEVPVLILSGELDPITPPRWGKSAAQNLPNSTHIVVSGVGHGTTHYSCVARMIAEFVERGGSANLTTDCLEPIKRFPFFLQPTGPIAVSAKGTTND